MNPAVLALGELNVDLVLGGLSSTPRLGRELIASDLDLTLGSATAIFACQVRKLGHPVTFVGRVGGDEFGAFCVRELAKLGIDTEAIVRTEGVATGLTLSLPVRGDRAQVTYLGAIAELAEHDFPPDIFECHDHLHLSSIALQKRLQPAFPRLLRRAREAGLTTSLDPNSELRGTLRQSVLELLPDVDLLFLNEREARELSEVTNTQRALEVLARRVRGVVIKLGPRGAIAALDGQRAESVTSRVLAIDTTGAGDSFAGGFVSAFLRGSTLVDCLRLGNLCGTASTAALGGTAGQPTLADVYQAGWAAGNGAAP